MAQEWVNWSGSLKFTPGVFEFPESEEEVIAIVNKALDSAKKIRVAGAGHSSVPLVQTDDILVSMKRQKQLLSIDHIHNRAVLQTGMTVHEAGQALLREGLVMHNTGDVDVQLLTGAISTGTHGTGRSLQNLSTMLFGVRMINGIGEVIDTDEEKDPELMRAIRVSLGTMGIFTQIKLKLQPKFKLDRKEFFTDIKTCLAHWEEISTSNRNADFYWYPRTDVAKIRIMNEPGTSMEMLTFGKLDKHSMGWSADILPRHRELRFDEMEYKLPVESSIDCLNKVMERIKARHRKSVAWRVLYRTIKRDDNYLSPASERDTATISLHHNAGLPFEEYFNDIEPIFIAYNGRPHWGKKHNLTAKDLKHLYPHWDKFHSYREQMDPHCLFITPYLKKLLIDG